MNKYYIITILAISLTSMTLRAADFEEFDDITEVETTGIAINVNGAQVHVTGAAGQTLEVYNVAGMRVATYKIDGDDKTFNLNLSKGCYILKIGKVVRKVSIR